VATYIRKHAQAHTLAVIHARIGEAIDVDIICVRVKYFANASIKFIIDDRAPAQAFRVVKIKRM
jgi:hypothetical protein